MLDENGRLALIFAPMVATPSALGQGQLNHPDADEGKFEFVGVLGAISTWASITITTSKPKTLVLLSKSPTQCFASPLI